METLGINPPPPLSQRKRSHSALDVTGPFFPQSNIKRLRVEPSQPIARRGIREISSQGDTSLFNNAPIATTTSSPSSLSSSSSSSSSSSINLADDDSPSESTDSSNDSSDDDSSSSPSVEGSSSASSPSSSSNASSRSTSPIPTITTLPRPAIRPFAADGLTLQSRLSSFLPTLAAANDELENLRQDGRLGERDIENIEGGDAGEVQRPYIEMNLGLGVLEEKKEDVDGDGSSNSDGDEEESEGQRGSDVLGKLMGRGKRREKPGIEVVGQTQDPVAMTP